MNTLVCRKRYFVYKNFRGGRGSFEIIQDKIGIVARS